LPTKKGKNKLKGRGKSHIDRGGTFGFHLGRKCKERLVSKKHPQKKYTPEGKTGIHQKEKKDSEWNTVDPPERGSVAGP